MKPPIPPGWVPGTHLPYEFWDPETNQMGPCRQVTVDSGVFDKLEVDFQRCQTMFHYFYLKNELRVENLAAVSTLIIIHEYLYYS